ncbi:iron-sulfur cluster assembly accessory protein [Paenibacillus sp. HJL G12]|uniref:Iron-sulfur cluster assembly accessory protein n=1 Tax=Paenibacillus dendrobii TaxID=2691084 RepID=A0A7X3IRH9_9BACL|nr:iron-sulfur cluster assembly accessory protein [Paenibacillus dendrobii]MWV46907.1 iron-sulfur cluster assembly accessory protein [Paenibacillus dendrobii]
MINISDSASDKLKEMLADQEIPNMFLRLGVQEGGCSGFSYAMGFDDEESENDVYMDVKDLKVVVDKQSLPLINGLEIDFEDAGMSGGFTMSNPNATATCGCGASFRTATNAGKPAPEEC